MNMAPFRAILGVAVDKPGEPIEVVGNYLTKKCFLKNYSTSYFQFLENVNWRLLHRALVSLNLSYVDAGPGWRSYRNTVGFSQLKFELRHIRKCSAKTNCQYRVEMRTSRNLMRDALQDKKTEFVSVEVGLNLISFLNN